MQATGDTGASSHRARRSLTSYFDYGARMPLDSPLKSIEQPFERTESAEYRKCGMECHRAGVSPPVCQPMGIGRVAHISANLAPQFAVYTHRHSYWCVPTIRIPGPVCVCSIIRNPVVWPEFVKQYKKINTDRVRSNCSRRRARSSIFQEGLWRF